MERSLPDGTGPIYVPLGHIVACERWRGSQLAQEMQADLVAGKGYRKRLVQIRNSSHLQGIVLVEKTQMSEQYFPAAQKFTVLDLGMVLLPVCSQKEAASLIIQLVHEQAKEPSKNPFLRKKRAQLSEPSLLQTVQQIPGVGKVKAPLLLQKFPSIQHLSNASMQELEHVVGQAAAQRIHTFFTQSSDSAPRAL
ncbi:Fanconi anemia core complex-associated protein 24 isoform X2 [Echinops telfairi]|uniref:Fanconi anemia core complex-associated protein 24 isoform X2 n=1 Tax=Echinops telfairi TaxID=9371 RepID=A0AC55DD73_ECHTE|nr:Fanconi anemia core complex-associated protein 24 isoform X2 [Echinops telfairi]